MVQRQVVEAEDGEADPKSQGAANVYNQMEPAVLNHMLGDLHLGADVEKHAAIVIVILGLHLVGELCFDQELVAGWGTRLGSAAPACHEFFSKPTNELGKFGNLGGTQLLVVGTALVGGQPGYDAA